VAFEICKTEEDKQGAMGVSEVFPEAPKALIQHSVAM
jgi:hypothetical protein